MKKVASKTLDTQHHRMLASFEQETQRIREKERELNVITDELKHLGEIDKMENDKLIEWYLHLTNIKKKVDRELKEARIRADELNYFVDTADIVFKYYDIIEKGSNGDADNVLVGKNSILKYFANDSKEDDQDGGSATAATIIVGGGNSEEDRASLLDRYMEQIDSNYVKNVKQSCETCPNCDSIHRTVFVNDGLSYCNDCFTIETIIIDHEKPSYKDPPKEISYFCYKRINHLSESTVYSYFVLQEEKSLVILIYLKP